MSYFLLCGPAPAHAWGGRNRPERPRPAGRAARGLLASALGAPAIPAPGVAAPQALRQSTLSPSYFTLCGPAPAHAWGGRH
eukprot:5384741-Alexandrium_andersonii.AAC.1